MRLTIHSLSINSQRIRCFVESIIPIQFLHHNTNDPSPRSSTHLNLQYEIPSNNNPPPQPPRSKHHFRRKPLPSFSQPSLKKQAPLKATSLTPRDAEPQYYPGYCSIPNCGHGPEKRAAQAADKAWKRALEEVGLEEAE